MALLRDVIFKAGPKWNHLISEEKKLMNLKFVNKLILKFDPFREGAVDFRAFSHLIHDPAILVSHPKLVYKTEILSDRSEPTVTFDLSDGKKFIFKCGNLKCLEIFQLINKHITPLAPKEETTASFTPISLSQGKGKGKRKGK